VSQLAAGLALAAALSAGAAHAQYARPAQTVINRARAASGGNGWNYLRGWHETGTDGGVAYDRWLDPLRYGMRVEAHEASGGVSVHGFNGAGDWRITASGAVTGVADAKVVAAARTEAFYGVYGFFFPGRFDARGKLAGVRKAGGRSFDVVEVTPWGAASRELWFDRKTGLLGRMVDRSGGRATTTELSDYRKIGPLTVAFRAVTEDGTPGGMHVRQIQTLIFTPADRTMFSLPRP
jgi:hypothetical protein